MELEASRLTKQYGSKTAVGNLNITLSNGVYGLLGANGAGKSTTLHAISGLIKPKNGEASVEYLNPETVNGAKYSDRIRLTFDGWTAADSVINADFFKNNYKVVITEYSGSAEDEIIDATVVHGKNGETVKATSRIGQGFSFAV